MKISEYQTNRHAEAVRRRLADAHAELEQLLADARASLTPTPPTQGAPWDATNATINYNYTGA